MVFLKNNTTNKKYKHGLSVLFTNAHHTRIMQLHCKSTSRMVYFYAIIRRMSMRNISKKYIRLLCLFLFISLLASVPAVFLPLLGVRAEGAGSINGTVRVYLASLGSITNLDITPTAGASLEFGDTIPISQSANVHLSADKGSGTITASVNGVRYVCGKALILNGAGFRIAQALVNTNTYPGSLLMSSQGSENNYHLTVIAYIKIEDYLVGVLPYEMGV